MSLQSWEPPRNIDHPVALDTWTRSAFDDYYDYQDAKIWFMTEEQRETWKQEIVGNWDDYKDLLAMDAFGRHIKQLVDMHTIGGGISGGMIVIKQAYGMGKSVISNIHLKLWQLIKYNTWKRYYWPYIYWRRSEARDLIKAAPNNTAHSVDEDQRGSGSGSQAVVKHLLNMFETIRKTGKLVLQCGLNVDIGALGRAVAMEICPFGYNLDTQTSRFIVKNYKGRPLWLAALQRIYTPDEKVYYGTELGTFAEYDKRAEAMSQSSDGIYSERKTDNEKTLRDLLVKHWLDNFEGETPVRDALTFEARQLFDPAVEDQMDEIVGSARVFIKREMRKRPVDKDRTGRAIEITSKGWDYFRDLLKELAFTYGAGKQHQERDAEAFAYFYCPLEPAWKYKDVAHHIGFTGQPDSLGAQLRRLKTDIPTKPLGDVGEIALASWLDSLTPVRPPSTSKETEDILVLGGAINVKTTLEDAYREHVPTTPEYHHRPKAILALIVPRLLQIRLFKITQPKQSFNLVNGRLTTPSRLPEDIADMLTTNENREEPVAGPVGGSNHDGGMRG